MSTIATWLAAGGPLLWPIAAVGLAAWVLLCERCLVLWGASGREAVAQARHSLAVHPQLRGVVLADLRWNLDRGFAIAAACCAAAPLLGLLGTVVGIILSFTGIVFGGDPARSAGGIGQALLTTQFGLCVSLPGVLALAILRRRSEQLVVDAQVQLS